MLLFHQAAALRQLQHIVRIADAPAKLGRFLAHLAQRIVILRLAHHSFKQRIHHNLRVRQLALHHFKKRFHLRFVKIHQHAFNNQQHRLAMRGNGVRPAFVKHGRAQIMIARFRQQHTPHFYHFGQIKVVPRGNGGSPHALVTRVQARTQLHHHRIGVFGDKPRCHVVQQFRPPAAAHLRGLGFGKRGKIVINHRQHSCGFFVAQQRIRALIFHRLCPQRNQHGGGQHGDVFGGDFFLAHFVSPCC